MNNKLSFKQIIVAGLIAASVSAVINTVLFFIFQAAGVFTNDIMIQPNQPLSVIPVILASIIPTSIASCIFFLFEKYGRNGFKTVSIVSTILLVLSFANPFFGIPNVTVPYAVALNLMHIVVAFSLLYFIKRAKNNLV